MNRKIIVEPGKKVRIVEMCLEHQSTNDVRELSISIGEGAELEHIRVIDKSNGDSYFNHTNVVVNSRGNYDFKGLVLGGKTVSNDITVKLAEKGALCSLQGLNLSNDADVSDFQILVEHAEQKTKSHQAFRGVLSGKSQGTYHGRVIIHEGADKSEAFQMNRNLLLSDDAQVKAEPQLEIYADDIACKHGATIGQLDNQAMFYLTSRGISEQEARFMLTRAFVWEMLESFDDDVKGLVEKKLMVM